MYLFHNRFSRSFVFLIFFAALLGTGFAGCGSGSDSGAANNGTDESSSSVYPMFTDSNTNGINDYYEQSTHDAGSVAAVVSAALYGHTFTDNDHDGVCDYAQDGSATWHGPGFVDSDGDGVCDYWQETSSVHNMNGGMNFHDSNTNGINDYMESTWHQGNGHDFVDNNGDGVCDYAQDGSATWHGPGFVDSDGDGVCDYWQVGGMGYGSGHDTDGGSMGPMM